MCFGVEKEGASEQKQKLNYHNRKLGDSVKNGEWKTTSVNTWFRNLEVNTKRKGCNY